MSAEGKVKRLSRRSLLGGAAALAVGGLAAACQSSSSASSAAASGQAGPSLLEEIQKRGTLNVITQLKYPPEMYRDANNQPAGYDIELLNMMAKDLNVKLNVLDQDKFESIIPALLAGKGDLVSVGLVNTPKRALTLAFSKGYVPYGQVLMVPANSPATSPSDLNKQGVVITALLGSTAYFRAQLLFPKATVQGLEQEPALLAVATGKADACLVEVYLAQPFLKQHSNVRLLNDGRPIATEFGCFGIRQGDQLWLNWLDNWVRYNTDNQVLPGLYQKIIQQPWVQPS